MYTPRWYQNEAVDSIFLYYAKGATGNPVVAMPTATGKSLVIAEFCKKVLQRWPRQRIIVATHVKELIEQNADDIKIQWPQVPLGIFSAGLKQKDTQHPLIYGGVQSMVNDIQAFGYRDLLMVDEGHLISLKDDSNYQRFIAGLKLRNPNLKVIGLSATPYRIGQGLITDGGTFTDICYNMCSFENYNKLIDEGFICMHVPKRMKTQLDVDDVPMTAGEFNQHELQHAVDKETVTYAACYEAWQEGHERMSWLAFASGIEHSQHIAAILQSFGIHALEVHSKLPTGEADKRIKLFKQNKLRCIVNYGKLTTGFNHPPIDLIIMLRPTMSTSLWVQMLGRGGRPSIETRKENCLVLDFAGNTPRLGCINDPVIPRKRIKGATPGVAPVRICDMCGVYNHARAVVCCSCGAAFPKREKLIPTAGTDELVRREKKQAVIGVFTVQHVFHNRYQRSLEAKPIMKVSYQCGLKLFSEYVCFEHDGLPRKKAVLWWLKHMGAAPPKTTDEALQQVSRMPWPKIIHVRTDEKYPEVISHEF